jgi:glycosyltransferase involved in cell wall biosynthesis
MVTGLVHDYLLVMRGAERTFQQIAACYPQAPIYTLLYDDRRLGRVFGDRVAGASMLQHLPVRQTGFRRLFPLFPLAAERLDVGEHDIIVSSSSAFAHGIRPRPGTTHINYCHSPFRYVWHERDRALCDAPPMARRLLSRELDRIRRWDLDAAGRVDHFIANSRITQERIADFYGRDSVIVHPPVDVNRFAIGKSEDFFLVVGELVSHKRVADALLAAETAGRRVKIVGTGPDAMRLRNRFGHVAEFLGRVQDDHLTDLMARAQAVIVPNVEEFGIVAVEANAAGRPVIGPNRGGTSETIIDGMTGVLFEAGDFDAVAEILREVDFDRFDPMTIRRSALRFRAEVFRERLRAEVRRLAGVAATEPPPIEHGEPFAGRTDGAPTAAVTDPPATGAAEFALRD